MPGNDENDWITPEQLAEMRRRERDADHAIFIRQFVGNWPAQKRQCQRQSIDRHYLCTNEAKFSIVHHHTDKIKYVCEHCIPTIMLTFRSGSEFLVVKL